MSDWIKWEGGKCPVGEGVDVDFRLRDGCEDIEVEACYLEWDHIGAGSDVVSYRVSGQVDAAESALDVQVEGNHYKQFEIQPVEFVNANNMDFLQGSVVKYISRHKLKGKKADVEKAIHFCKLILELQYGKGE